MTIAELKSAMEHGALIECKTVSQREDAIRFLVDIGYKVGSSTEDYLRTSPNSTRYMYPGLSISNRTIVCWSSTDEATEVIPYETVIELIIQNDRLIDDRSDAEFASDFALLLY